MAVELEAAAAADEEKESGRNMKRKSVYQFCSIAAACLMALPLTACGEISETAVQEETGVTAGESGAPGGNADGSSDAGGAAGEGSGSGGSAGGNSVPGGAAGEDGGAGGITGEDGGSGGTSARQAGSQAVSVIDTVDLFTDRDLAGDYKESKSVKIVLADGSAQCSSGAVTVDGGIVTIGEEGTYLLSGTLREGMIVVAAKDTAKVQLVFQGVDIRNTADAAVYVKSADKVFVTLEAGSVNTLENSGGYTVLDENNIDGVIFCKSDLTLNGTGSLEVTAAEGHGIVSKDDLKITGGNLTVTAQGHGLSGKDSVRIAGGSISVTSGRDGIRSDHDTDEEKGYVYIADGDFTIYSGGDGISASRILQIDGGKFAVTAGGGAENRTVAKDSSGEEVSTKGIKAAGSVVLNGGIFAMDTQDDALHSNENLTVNGGEYQIATGDDAFHADETMTVTDGMIDISTSYEGIEGNHVIISGGSIRLYATDDGINAAGGNDQSGFGGMFGRDRFGGGRAGSGGVGGTGNGGNSGGADSAGSGGNGSGADSAGNGGNGGGADGAGSGGNGGGADSAGSDGASLLISGGTVYVNADGDGLDSNGTLTVTGGELYVSGPSNDGNGALDYDGSGQITGGYVIAAGSAGMAMNFGDTSTQGSILITTDRQSAGTEIVVKDSSGKELMSYTAESAFNSVTASCPEMVQGGTYTILVGDSEQSVTLENLIYGSGTGGFGGFGGMGGHGGRGDMGGMGGKMPGGQMPEAPEDGRPQLPEGGLPETPAGELPKGGLPELPDGELPDFPEGEMPEGGMPQLPDGEKKRLPDGEVPQLPDGEKTKSPDGEDAGTA